MPDARILIIEDESITALAIKHKLERLGYSILAIESCGDKAFEKTMELEPDLILMDIVLKGKIDGIEAADKITQEFNIPIIYLTAYSEDNILEKAKLTKPYGYINKPFSDADLKSAIETALYKHQFELELLNSEKKYRQIVETANEGIWAMDNNSKTTFVNSKMAEMLGYTTEEMIGMPVDFFMFEDDLQDHEAKMLSRKKGISEQYERRFRHKNGPEIWTIVSVTALKDDKNNFTGSFAMFTDITKYKKAQEALKYNETRFRELFNNMSSGVAVYEAKNNASDFIFKDFNKTAAKIENLKKEDVINKSLIELFPNVKNFGLFEVLQRVWKTGIPEHFPASYYNDQRIIGWRENYIYKLPSGEIVAVYEDVTEQKNAEKTLQESENKYHALFDNAGEGILILEEDKFIDCNSMAMELYGASREEIIGKTPYEFSPKYQSNDELSKEKALKHINKALNGDQQQFEWIHESLDGKIKYTEVTLNLLKINEENYLMAIIHDISERVKAEENLKESEIKYKDLANLLPQIVCETDNNGLITFCNEVATDLTGYTNEELKNRNIFQMVIPEEKEKVKKNLHLIIEGKNSNDREFTIIGKDGSTFPVIIYSSPIIHNNEFMGLRSILVDISEIKHVQKSLESSKEKYKALIQASPEAVIVTDIAGKIIFVSPKTLEICKAWKYEELINKSAFDFISSEYHEKAIKDLHKIQNKGYRSNVEYKFVKLDGTPFLGELNASLIKNSKGEPKSIIFTLRDITKIKNAESYLKENEEKYRALFNSSPDNIILVGTDGKLMDVNEAALNNTGLKASDLIGKHFTELKILPKEDMSLHLKKVTQVLKGESIEPYESRFIDKYGQIHHVETYASPLGKEGEISGLQIISHDVTNRKKAEDKLKESEENFRQIAETIEEVFWIIDTKMREIIYISPAYEEIWGLSCESLYKNPKSWIDSIHPDDRKIAVSIMFNENHDVYVGDKSLEYRIIRPNNDVRWISGKGFPIFNESGELYRIVGIARDITDLKKSENALKMSEAYYRTIFENTGTVTLIIEEDTTISLVNSEFEEFSAYSKEEVEGKKSWTEFVANKDDLDKMRDYQYLRRIDSKSAPRNYEFKFIDKNGIVKDAFITVSIIPGTKKSLVSLLDITDKKQSRNALKESEQKYRQLVEKAHEGICSIDSEGIITFVNPRMAEMLGYTVSEISERSISSFIDKDQVEGMKEYLKSPDITFEEPYDLKLIKKDGETIHTRVEISIINDENGNNKEILALVADITESKKAEDALKENEMYMKKILATIQTGIVVIDAKTKEIIDVNKAAIELIGATKYEIIGKTCHKFICPVEKGKCPITDMNQEIDNSERILLTANNERIPIIKSVVPITLKGRECILDSFIDIRELKKLEKSLKVSKEKYKALIKASPEAIIATDLDGNITFVSPKTLELYGFEKYEDVIGENGSKFIAPECLKKAKSDVKDILKGKSHQNLVYQFIKANDTHFIGELNLSIIRNNKEKPESIIFIIRDITEIKKAEEQIKQSNIYHRGLIEASLDPLVTIGPDGKITDVNTATEKVTGYSRNELVETDFSDYFTEPKKAREGYQQVFKDGVVKNYELEIKNKEGDIILVSYNASVYTDENNDVIGVFAAARDITEIKEAEKNIKASLKEKEVLLREIHHRVKNNLQIISSLLSLQSDYINDDEALDIFTESQNRVKTMAMIHEKLYKSDCLMKINFGDYVEELADSLFYNYRISPNMIKLRKNMDNVFFDVNTSIPCGLIINELVTNCLKHAFPWFKASKSLEDSPQDLEFGKYQIDIELKPDNENYILTVADNGIGFPDDIDFKNTDSLGLQLVNNLVDQLDGTITLDKNEGTKFTIIFKENEYEDRI